MPVPHELAIGEVLFPPLLLAGVLGALVALGVGRVLNRFDLTRHFFYPPLVLLAMTVTFTMLLGSVLIGI